MKVLLVEDDRLISMALSVLVTSLGYMVTARVPSGEAAIAACEAEAPDLALMDIRLEGAMDGIEAAAIMRERWGIPVIFSSAYTDGPTVARAELVRPVAFLPKPVNADDLERLLAGIAFPAS
jgi:CheY-like chemotaxis protein